MFLVFSGMEISGLKLEKLVIFQKKLPKPKTKKKNYTGLCKEAKCSKLNYFLIIVIKHSFSFYDIFFSILNKLLFFII